MRRVVEGKFGLILISAVFFLGAISFRYFHLSLQNTPGRNAVHTEKRLQQELQTVESSLQELTRKLQNVDILTFESLYVHSKYPYFIFEKHRIFFWSVNTFVPKYRDVLGAFTRGYAETSKGKYAVRKAVVQRGDKSYEINFMIPLLTHTKVVNRYLKETINEDIFSGEDIDISKTQVDKKYNKVSLGPGAAFFVKYGNNYTNSDTWSTIELVLMVVGAFVFLILFVKRQLDIYIRDKQIFGGFLFLLSCILSVRSIMLLLHFPFDFIYLALFDPKYYGSSMINPSLGDLLLNVICLLVLGYYLFTKVSKSSIVKRLLRKQGTSTMIVSMVCVFFSFFWLTMHHQIMRTLNFDSRWPMDITQNLEFNYLRLISFFIFLLSMVIYFLFSHVCFRLFLQINKGNVTRAVSSFAGGMLFFMLMALFFRWNMTIVVITNLIFFFIVIWFRLPHFIGKIQYLTFIYIFAFALPGAGIGLYANYQYLRSNTDFNKSRLANQLLSESNFFTELQLADVAKKIQNDLFIQKRIFSPYASKLIIEKKIRREYLSQFEKFKTRIFLFNSKGSPFDAYASQGNYHEIKSKLSEFQTETAGLYFINQAQGQPAIRYALFVEIQNRGQIVGYILVDLVQKRSVPNSVFPLLLSDNSYAQDIEGSNMFSYGMFDEGELRYNYGAFNYQKNLQQIVAHANEIFDENVRIAGFNHRAFKGQGEKAVIISDREPSLNFRVANFSFLFLLYVFTILVLLIGITIYQNLRKIKLNYATKIQLYLNFAFFTPLIIISVTTVSIIVQTFKSSLEQQYLEYAKNLSAQISGPLSEYRKLNIDEEDLSDEVYKMAEVADLDINIFHNKGRLIASSLKQIYQNEILSGNIHPRAYIKIVEELESSFVQEEQVGRLLYKDVYVAIRDYESGDIIGILSLPFFASQQDLERNIVEVLSNIINIFTLVFIIFLFVSFFVSRGLIFPLKLITQKIRRTTLSTYNEPLSWNSDDEIGLMVAEYNRMLINLEESKRALARSEKESAWREMARQVAHEIKNPLTPMKLTLQHMNRMMLQGQQSEEQQKRMSQINSLLEQIDTLNDIATSFSDFAKMPAPRLEELDLGQLVRETVELYNKQELGRITVEIETGKWPISGDRKWLGRAFSNLIINGFQAVSDPARAHIEIKLFGKDDKWVHVEIKDNGHGIPEHIGDKVFTPNFSTKFTGSGLGLAITKRGIEHANGRIWFVSEEGKGTVFYIEIPMVE